LSWKIHIPNERLQFTIESLSLGTLSLFGGKSIKKLKKEICGLQKMKGNLQDIKEDKAERKNTNIEKNNNSLF
jgi:hypothetical protein